MLPARPPLSDSLPGTNWNICVKLADSYFWTRKRIPVLFESTKIPG